ncbi:MAG: TonB-dependent receptor plug domain-containing protein, partial [Bacteroidota bacterium]
MKNIVLPRQNGVVGLVALLFTVIVNARAQVPTSMSTADSLKTYALPEIVVTATRSEKNPDDVGRSISLISSEQLRNFMYLSVAEALSEQLGLYLVGVGQNLGANQSIFLRGSASNQTAIFVDDVRLTDPSGVNNALDLSELSFTGLERIEIVRGTHSTLYGSSAIGGVVNLISRKNRMPGFHADAELRTGTFGKGTSLFGQDLLLNYTHASGLYVNGELLNARVKGLDATLDTAASPPALKNRDGDGLQSFDALGKVGFTGEKLDMYVSLKTHREKKDVDKAAYRDDDNYWLDFKRKLLTYGASYSLSNHVSLKYVGGYSDMKRVAVDDSSVVDDAGNTDRTYTEAEYRGATTTNEIQAIVRLPGFE